MSRLFPALVLLGACNPPAAVEPREPCGECGLTDAQNYAYTSELSIGELPLPELVDSTVRWDGLTRDLRGDALDPIDEARLIAFRDLAPDEIAWALSHDALYQADVALYVTCATTAGRCALSEFGMMGNALGIQDYFEAGSATWLLVLGQAGGLQVEGLAFLSPQADGAAPEAVVTDDTSRLDVEVDLHSLTPVVVAPFETGIRLDWSGLAHDGLGDALDPDTVDELWVGRFAQTPAELEVRIFELESLAESSWTAIVSGTTSASLTQLEGTAPFAGIDRTGTWVAALRCHGCTNPAPRLLTFLEPAAP